MSSEINDIKEILNTFMFFVNQYESDLNQKPTVEEIKDDFKAAIFIEKTIRKFEEKNIVSKFINCLNGHMESLKRSKFYEVNFYKFACDNLLLKYFNGRKFDIDIALRMYSSSCDEKRFEFVVEKHILDSGINEAILNHIICNKDAINKSELECRLLLLNLRKEIEKGKLEETKTNLENMFNSYKIDKYLSLFLGILNLNDLSEEEESLKLMILQILLNKMDDRSFKSKEFWLTLIQNTNSNLLVQVSVCYKSFLNSLLKFLSYCACLMKYNENINQWVGDQDKSICPEITFDNILNIYKSLINVNSQTKEIVKSFINTVKNDTNSLFWDGIEKF